MKTYAIKLREEKEKNGFKTIKSALGAIGRMDTYLKAKRYLRKADLAIIENFKIRVTPNQ